MSWAIARMNAIVTMGKASCRKVCPYTATKLTLRRAAAISRKAMRHAYRTSEPAAARKFQSKVSAYSVDFEAIGFSRKMTDTGVPFLISYVPGQEKFQSGNLRAWRSLAGSGPIHGWGQSANFGVPHFKSAVMLAGAARAVLTSPGGCPTRKAG